MRKVRIPFLIIENYRTLKSTVKDMSLSQR